MKYSTLAFILCFASCMDNNQHLKLQTKDSTIPKKQIDHRPIIISDPTNTLDSKIQTLKLEYIDWSCACANWITPNDLLKYKDSTLSKHCIFIEPADTALKLFNNFNAGHQYIKVTGQFYLKTDYPKGTTKQEENLKKAKVFRYTIIDILKKAK